MFILCLYTSQKYDLNCNLSYEEYRLSAFILMNSNYFHR